MVCEEVVDIITRHDRDAVTLHDPGLLCRRRGTDLSATGEFAKVLGRRSNAGSCVCSTGFGAGPGSAWFDRVSAE